MLELLMNRRSTRKFTDKRVSKEQQTDILKAGMLAPSGQNKRPIEFITIEDKSTIETLVDIKSHGSTIPFKTATLAILVLGNHEISDTWAEDASIAATFMQLEVENLGLGSCWIHTNNRKTPSGESSDEVLRRLLQYPSSRKSLCILAIGHKSEVKSPYTSDFFDFTKVHSEKY